VTGADLIEVFSHVADPAWLLNRGLFVAEGRHVTRRLLASSRFTVVALLVTPAATAYQLTNRYGMMFVLSIAAGVVSCVAGLLVSYLIEVPSGASIVIVATLLFAAAALFSPKRRRCRVCGRRP